MAAITTQDRDRVARIFARKVYFGDLANCSHADLQAAVSALDAAFEGTAAALPGTAGQSIAARINAALPEPFASTSTLAQKSALLAIWTAIKYGLSIQFRPQDGD